MMNKKMMMLTGTILLLTAGSVTFASPASIVGKTVLKETVKNGAKVSGKALTKSSLKASEKLLAEGVMRYGDDALRAVEKGGLEVLEQSSKHGDDFIHLCAKASPRAARALAVNADELMPLVKRLGPEFLEMEGRHPGLGKRIISTFGDDSLKAFSKMPPSDATKLLGYAERADSPATAKKLLYAYEKTNGKILSHLNWKNIIAGGLTTSMIIAAYKLSDGAEDGLRIMAEKHPESFTETLSTTGRPVRYFLYAIGAVLLLPMLAFCWKCTRWINAWKFGRTPKSTITSGSAPDAQK